MFGDINRYQIVLFVDCSVISYRRIIKSASLLRILFSPLYLSVRNKRSK